MQTLTLPMPDDWHLHLRDGDMLNHVLPFTTRHFRRAIVMPNLTPPVVKTSDAIAYQERIQNASDNDSFKPLMTLYMTENTNPSDVKKGFEEGIVTAIKLYPAGATTNSDAGVKNMEAIYPVLETMQAIGMPLLVHGEVVDSEIDIFDREAVFIETKLKPVREKFPELKVVFEHITTKDGVDYVQSCNDGYTAATVTPHHLVINRNAMLVGGIKPHYYCLPVAKREKHRLALRKAVTSGDKRFFLGTDSAPHTQHAKESSCGCAGIFNVANALSVVAQVFDDENALQHLEGFVSRNGPTFYGLPVNESTITLNRIVEALPKLDPIETNEGNVIVFDPLMDLYWQVAL